MEKKIKRCFVIAPIGEPNTETRRRSDQVLKHIIEPAIKECGYAEAIRADKISDPGIITSQIIQSIIDFELVIADLTGSNPNVFYELAIRHVLKKPIVQIIKHDENIPFDISMQRTIKLNYQDLDSVAACKKELLNQIKAVEDDPSKVDSPISMAIDLKFLKNSENIQDKSSAEILSILQSLVNSFRRFEDQVALQNIAKTTQSKLLDFINSPMPVAAKPITIEEYLKKFSVPTASTISTTKTDL